MLTRLHEAIAAVCPLNGVSFGRRGDPDTVRIDYLPEATDAQKQAAKDVVTAFDWSNAVHTAWMEDRQPERRDLRQAAAKAIEDLDSYLAIADTATSGQVRSQVKRHAHILRTLIRRVTQI